MQDIGKYVKSKERCCLKVSFLVVVLLVAAGHCFLFQYSVSPMLTTLPNDADAEQVAQVGTRRMRTPKTSLNSTSATTVTAWRRGLFGESIDNAEGLSIPFVNMTVRRNTGATFQAVCQIPTISKAPFAFIQQSSENIDTLVINRSLCQRETVEVAYHFTPQGTAQIRAAVESDTVWKRKWLDQLRMPANYEWDFLKRAQGRDWNVNSVQWDQLNLVASGDNRTSRFKLPSDQGEIAIVRCGGANETSQIQLLTRAPYHTKYVERSRSVLRRKAAKMSQDSVPAPPNVVVLVLDALSRANFIYKLPRLSSLLQEIEYDMASKYRTYQFFRYSTLATNTPFNYGSLILGQRWEYDLAERDWLWNKAAQQGYVTLSSDAWCRKRSKSNQPLIDRGPWFQTGLADHNFNEAFCEPSFNARDGNVHAESRRRCLFGKDAHLHMFDHTLKFFQTYLKTPNGSSNNRTSPDNPPPLLATLHDYTPHEITQDLVEILDNDIVSFLRALLQLAPRTAVLIVGDHGASYGKFYQSRLGKLENRLPAAFLVLPYDVAEHSAATRANIWRNQQRLVTHLDMHHTLLHLFSFPYAPTKPALPDVPTWWKAPVDTSRQPARSSHDGYCFFVQDSACQHSFESVLSTEFPRERSCSQAGIPNEWCLFEPWRHLKVENKSSHQRDLEWVNIFTSEVMAQVKHAVDSSNGTCVPLRLAAVADAETNADVEPMEDTAFNHASTSVADVKVRGRLYLEATKLPSLKLKEMTLDCVVDIISRTVVHCYRVTPYSDPPCSIGGSAISLRKFCLC